MLISLAIDGKYVLKIPDESELLAPDEEVVIALSSIPRFPVDDWRRLKYQMRVVQLLTDHGEFTFHPERLP